MPDRQSKSDAWAVAVGVMRVVLAFEVKRLPDSVDEAFTTQTANGVARDRTAAPVNS